MSDGRYKLLHLDGNETHQALLSERLSSWAELVHASESEEARAQVNKGLFDLILLGELKAESFYSLCSPTIPVIVLVSRYDPDEARKMIARGAQDVLERDKAGGKEFVRALSHAMERGMAQS